MKNTTRTGYKNSKIEYITKDKEIDNEFKKFYKATAFSVKNCDFNIRLKENINILKDKIKQVIR